MPTVADVHRAISALAPERFAFSFDRVGLQVGNVDRQVRTGVVSLDHSVAAIDFARERGAEVLVAHHPLLFEPAKSVTTGDHTGRAILHLAENKIAFIAAHTNWDSARGGINDRLARDLGLLDLRPFGSGANVARLKVQTFVPAESLGALLEAASRAGAGVIGEYDHCSFQSEGFGTFRGSEASNPVVGERGRLERIPEVRLEMVLRADQRVGVDQAIRQAHPYEEPAIDFLVCVDDIEQPAGRIGRLREPLPLQDWVSDVDQQLGTKSLAWGEATKIIETVAVVGGAADSEWQSALRAGADAFLTGEVRQHQAVEVADTGMAIVAAGHFATEHPGCVELAERLRSSLPQVEWFVYEPPAGIGGRPLN